MGSTSRGFSSASCSNFSCFTSSCFVSSSGLVCYSSCSSCSWYAKRTFFFLCSHYACFSISLQESSKLFDSFTYACSCLDYGFLTSTFIVNWRLGLPLWFDDNFDFDRFDKSGGLGTKKLLSSLFSFYMLFRSEYSDSRGDSRPDKFDIKLFFDA